MGRARHKNEELADVPELASQGRHLRAVLQMGSLTDRKAFISKNVRQTEIKVMTQLLGKLSQCLLAAKIITVGRFRFHAAWLPGLDSNQGLQLQRLTCYRYTTGHRLEEDRAGVAAGHDLRLLRGGRHSDSTDLGVGTPIFYQVSKGRGRQRRMLGYFAAAAQSEGREVSRWIA